MVSQTVKVINEQGLHMRPAGVFAKEMTKFKCNVTIDIAAVSYTHLTLPTTSRV